jgi:protein-tyrosine-phosphatase
VNPFALEILKRNAHDVTNLRSKHVCEFQRPGAPAMNYVFTVCDAAVAEDCPPWPNQPIAGHWGMPDPAKATGSDAEKALVFAQTYAAMRRRILAFVALPFATLDRLSLLARVDQIGEQTATDNKG